MVTLDQTELHTKSSDALLLILAIDEQSAEKIGFVRHEVTLELRRWGLEALCDTVTLLTSELMTNAYLAIIRQEPALPAATIRFEMRRTGAGVLLEVTDPIDATVPKVGRPVADAESGRGLYLIDMLASRWGIRQEPGKKIVWAAIGDA